MDKAKAEKITRFLDDKLMSDSVREVLLSSFLRRRPAEDTEMKAARFIATELLDEAWINLQNIRLKKRNEATTTTHISL